MKTSKGFGVVEVIIIIAVIVLLAAAGWMYLNSIKPSTITKSNTEDTSSQMYTSPTYGISFTYPQPWTVGVTTVNSFPDQENIIVKDGNGKEVLGFYGYLGTGCEASTPSTSPASTNLTVANTVVTVSKSCNDNWNWVTAKAVKADRAGNDTLTITTWNFIDSANEDAAKKLLESLNGVSEVKAGDQ